MAKHHSQQSLLYMWPKRSRPDANSDNPASSMSETVSESEVRVNGVDSSIPSGTETSNSATGSSAATNTEGMSQPNCSACTLPCCLIQNHFNQ